MKKNSKYGSQLNELKDELTNIENKLVQERIRLCSRKKDEEWGKKKAKRSNTCLIVSLVLISAIILVAVILISTTPNFYDSYEIGYLIFAIIIVNILNIVLYSISQKAFSFLLLIATFSPVMFIAPFIALYLLIRESIENTQEANRRKDETAFQETCVLSLEKQISSVKRQLKKTENLISYATNLYQQALDSGDEETMKRAAAEGCVEAAAYLDREKKKRERKEGKKLYKQATAAESVDEKIMETAAKLGDVSACLYFGRKYFSELGSNLLTRNEKKKNMQKAAEYLEKVKDEDTEAEFLWLSARTEYESNTSTGWHSMLDRVRKIKASGKLAESYDESINSLIECIVEIIDRIQREVAEEEKMRASARNVGTNWSGLTPTSTNTSSTGDKHGPLATAINCGMPPIDCSDM